ncbi:hypothetical protein KV205_30715 [Streptomyces sp. SKN60]|uniref:hypothetical protein n=1 Tax=Streptomyces sp. SKN60 TaxID=2855506 RepID=UPI002246A7A7|nr:hypothetical protein [Streptomyces sp. SKN60]MCX2184868.1 hypothetical protein [Streptomyces sp. SKN60]
MSFEEEWAGLKRGAAERQSATRLNQLPPESGGSGAGGGDADLGVNHDKLGAIGHAAFELHGRLLKDGDHARATTEQAGASMSSSRFRTGGAMATVQETWSSQVSALLDACAHISNHLDYSAAQHAKDDEEIRTSLAVSAINTYFK